VIFITLTVKIDKEDKKGIHFDEIEGVEI